MNKHLSVSQYEKTKCFWFVKQNLSIVSRTFISSKVMQLVCRYITCTFFIFFFLFFLTSDSHKKNWIMLLNHEILDQYITYIVFFFSLRGIKLSVFSTLVHCKIYGINEKKLNLYYHTLY